MKILVLVGYDIFGSLISRSSVTEDNRNFTGTVIRPILKQADAGRRCKRSANVTRLD
jgi:hypothetical protein